MLRRRIGLAVFGLLATGITVPAAAAPAAAAAAAPAVVPHALPVDHVIGRVWGPGVDGEIGDGVSADSSVPITYGGQQNGVRAISTGGLHTLAAMSDGSVLSSGYNGSGEIGDGTYTERLTAVTVPGLTGVVQVVAAGRFSLALKSDGTVWAWGANFHGQLGTGTGLDSTTPVQVTALTGVTQIAGGSGDTAFALRGDGTVWGWGDNTLGQVGDGTTTTRLSPVQVVGLSAVRQLSSQGWSSLVVRTDGTVWGWGDNEEGGLGDGTTTDRRTPVQIPGLTGVRMVAAGPHSDAVLADGTVLGWGANDRGQLGNGTVGANQLTPVVVPALTGVTQIAVGTYHSLALLTNGTVLSWGWNANGRLGDGSVTDRSSPVPVSGLAHATAVSAGSSSAAVVALPYFTMSLTPAGGRVHAGGAATTQVRLTGINGYTSKAALSVTGLPSGVTATFSPPAASPSVPSTLTLHTSLGTPNGNYAITVVATSSASAEPTRTALFGLAVVAPAADFTISLSEPFGQAGAGASDSTQIQLNPINGYAETVTASAVLKPLPLGMTLTLSATHAGATTPVTLTVSTTFDTPQGTYLITVGGLADDPLVRPFRSTTYTFTVGPPIG